MDQTGFKNSALRLGFELILVVALVSYHIGFPKGVSFAQSWAFAVTHPLVLLHIVVGTVILVEAALLLIRSIQSRRTSWMVWSAFGLILVLIAWAFGESFMATQRNAAVDAMGEAWFGALVVYGLAWQLNRKKAVKAVQQG